MASPKILNAFVQHSQLLLIRGETGVGKTHLIDTALKQAPVKKKLIRYDGLDFDERQFSLNLYSKSFDGLARVIVLDHFDKFQQVDIDTVVKWSKKRTNTKRATNFKFIRHSSVILVCDVIYMPFLKLLSIDPLDIIDILAPSRDEQLAFLKSKIPSANVNHIQYCKNYFDLQLRINELDPLNTVIEKKPIYHHPNPKIARYYALKNNNTTNENNHSLPKTIKSNLGLDHDKSLFRDNVFTAINTIRRQSKHARGLSVNSFDKCSQFEQDFLAIKYQELLCVTSLPSSSSLEDISSSMDIFCDVDLHRYHWPTFVKETFYQLAVYQSPTYEQKTPKNQMICSTTITTNRNLDDIQIAIHCFGNSKMDFLHQLWTIYDVSNLMTLEIFPPGFYDTEEHRKTHNQKAIELAAFRCTNQNTKRTKEESKQTKKRKFYA